MIIEILHLIFYTSLTVLAWKTVISEGMLLDDVGYFLEYKIDQGHKKFNLLYCPWCMPTLFSFAGFGFAFSLGVLPLHWYYEYIALYALCLFGSSLVCGLVWTSYTTMNAKKEYYQAEVEYKEEFDDAFNELN